MQKKMLGRIIAAAGISLLCATSAFAEDAPSLGIVYNTKETNSLNYSCEKGRDNSLECEFTQTRIRKEAKPEELKARLDEARKEFSTSKELTPEFCKVQEEFLDVLHGRKKATNREQQDYLKNLSDLEKKDVLKIMDAFADACNSKSEESYLSVVRIGFDKDTRTCAISSNVYKQSFRLVLDPVSGARSWVAKGDPSGPCGIVQLSRFVPEKLKDSKLVFWKYIAKKAVTNREGSLMQGMACKDLDEDEYIFDWRSKEHALGCDYIKFSAF